MSPATTFSQRINSKKSSRRASLTDSSRRRGSKYGKRGQQMASNENSGLYKTASVAKLHGTGSASPLLKGVLDIKSSDAKGSASPQQQLSASSQQRRASLRKMGKKRVSSNNLSRRGSVASAHLVDLHDVSGYYFPKAPFTRTWRLFCLFGTVYYGIMVPIRFSFYWKVAGRNGTLLSQNLCNRTSNSTPFPPNKYECARSRAYPTIH